MTGRKRSRSLPDEAWWRDRIRTETPSLTAAQVEAVLALLEEAYWAGQHDEFGQGVISKMTKAEALSRKGVEARRRSSRRADVAQAFDAAAKTGADVSVSELARRMKVSRSTAYRALRAKTPAKRKK
jgi:hypothetical protein